MKFTTIATSALAFNSIWAVPVNQAAQSDNNTLTTQDTYNTTYPYDIHQYVNAEQIYDKLQEIAKIPKEEFIQKTNECIDKIQKALDITIDLGQRLDNLSEGQKQQLDALWTQIAPKYEQPLPSDPNQLKQLVAPDLLQFIQIVYQGDSIQALNNYTQLLQN